MKAVVTGDSQQAMERAASAVIERTRVPTLLVSEQNGDGTTVRLFVPSEQRLRSQSRLRRATYCANAMTWILLIGIWWLRGWMALLPVWAVSAIMSIGSVLAMGCAAFGAAPFLAAPGEDTAKRPHRVATDGSGIAVVARSGVRALKWREIQSVLWLPLFKTLLLKTADGGNVQLSLSAHTARDREELLSLILGQCDLVPPGAGGARGSLHSPGALLRPVIRFHRRSALPAPGRLPADGESRQ